MELRVTIAQAQGTAHFLPDFFILPVAWRPFPLAFTLAPRFSSAPLFASGTLYLNHPLGLLLGLLQGFFLPPSWPDVTPAAPSPDSATEADRILDFHNPFSTQTFTRVDSHLIPQPFSLSLEKDLALSCFLQAFNLFSQRLPFSLHSCLHGFANIDLNSIITKYNLNEHVWEQMTGFWKTHNSIREKSDQPIRNWPASQL